MSDVTKIEYLDATWNPVVGCTHVSEGCRNCWAEKQAKRWGQKWGAVRLHPDRLDIPLHWRKPRRVGVCFMGDLFHEDVPDEFIVSVFGTMQLMERHTFFVLTKRPSRMAAMEWIGPVLSKAFPLRNVFLGTSVEDQRTADERIVHVSRLNDLGWRTWLSYEPALGPLSIDDACYSQMRLAQDEGWGLDWVVCGGESGPGARPMEADWARSVRDQCKAAGVPFFMKQMSKKAPIPEDLRIREFPNA